MKSALSWYCISDIMINDLKMQVSFISADSWKKKKKNLTHHFKEPGDNGPCDIHVDDVEKRSLENQ